MMRQGNMKLKAVLVIAGMSASLLGQIVAQDAATGSGTNAWFAAPERGFVSQRPALDWTGSLVTGNGIMGALVPGNAIDETLYLSHAALYLPREKRSQSKPTALASIFPQMRQLCLDGKFEEAGELMQKTMRSFPYEATLTDPYIGAMTLRIEQENTDISRYQRSVDFMTGEATVTYQTPQGVFRRSTFVSRADNVIVVRLTGTGKQNAAISFGELPGKDFKEIKEIAKRVKSVEVGAFGSKGIRFQTTYATPNEYSPLVGSEAVGRIVQKGGKIGRTQPGYKFNDADEILVLIRIRPRMKTDGENNLEAIQKELDALPADYDKLLAAHTKIHGDLMGRVSLSLNAPAADRAKSSEELIEAAQTMEAPLAQIERAFDAGRYNIISSTGYNPPNLQGLWNGCWMAPWGSAMTTDGNLPCAISFLAMGNTPELLEPFFRYHERFVPGYRALMKNHLGMRGLLMPAQLTTAPVYVGGGPNMPFIYWYAGTPWALQPFYDYWLTTGDKKFLAERAYPLMKEMAAFYEDFLTETDKNGKVIFAPTYSPENEPEGWSKLTRLTVNAAMEVGAAKQLLRHAIAAARELGCDAELQKKWEALLAKMPAYEVGADGSFREWLWPGLKDNNAHRHASHFYPLYDEMPEEIISNPALVKAVGYSGQARMDYAEAHPVAPFGMVQVGLAAAHVGDAPLAQRVINVLQRLWSHGMMSYLCGKMFGTDISGGFPYLCASTLVYSDPGLIRFFPARPEQWKSGSIKGLRLRGAITLAELTWDGAKAKAVLVSDKDQTVTIVRTGMKAQTCALSAGKAAEVNFEMR